MKSNKIILSIIFSYSVNAGDDYESLHYTMPDGDQEEMISHFIDRNIESSQDNKSNKCDFVAVLNVIALQESYELSDGDLSFMQSFSKSDNNLLGDKILRLVDSFCVRYHIPYASQLLNRQITREYCDGHEYELPIQYDEDLVRSTMLPQDLMDELHSNIVDIPDSIFTNILTGLIGCGRFYNQEFRSTAALNYLSYNSNYIMLMQILNLNFNCDLYDGSEFSLHLKYKNNLAISKLFELYSYNAHKVFSMNSDVMQLLQIAEIDSLSLPRSQVHVIEYLLSNNIMRFPRSLTFNNTHNEFEKYTFNMIPNGESFKLYVDLLEDISCIESREKSEKILEFYAKYYTMEKSPNMIAGQYVYDLTIKSGLFNAYCGEIEESTTS
ncbi:hypothetical protein [Candidatus Cytomitobacter primus]|uniref:Uncharacterized protein n=1 Tax=Candidatus Cytomitobacter primus TaxID=2066024 RepID=A0A5C0UFB8_9PROT|nr:hypothetical protein [Candidatus Cytomitobacter primus]QEK38410.1 hypothetical protein FZC34_00545 [Candidatus Cytomitobacter primus]